MKLRDYQMTMIEDCRAAFRKGARRVLLQLPTGGGKSYVAAYMAKQNTDKGRRVLFLSHRREINEQVTETFIAAGVDMNLCDVMMVQTATRHTDIIKSPSLILCDECHHSSCSTYNNIYNAFPDTPIVGYSATPARLSGKPLSTAYDALIPGVSMRWLIDNNYLCSYTYYAPPFIDLSGVRKKTTGDYDTTEQEQILSKPKIYGDILYTYNALARGVKAICFAPTVAYSRRMADAFSAAGIAAAHLDGKTAPTVRHGIMTDFRNGVIQIICNADILGEGVSVDDCGAIIMLRKTASIGLYLQQVGRALRYRQGKRAVLIDHAGNYATHGLPMDDREWSLSAPVQPRKELNVQGELNLRQCKACFGCFVTAPVCPYCGALYATTEREIQAMQNVRLREIREDDMRRKQDDRRAVDAIVADYTSEAQCRYARELFAYARVHGKSSGWAYVMAKKRGLLK